MSRRSRRVSTDHAAAVCERVMVTDEPRTTTFEEFFMVEYPRLVPMLTAWCGDRETARDLAQDALVQAEARWTDVAVLDNPGAWVRRVALNRSSNEARRRRREAAAVGRLGHRAADPTAGEPAAPDAELWRSVRSLPRAQRQAVVLRYVDDLALADIALVIGCSEGTVKTHLQRGRATLAARLTDGDPPTRAQDGER